MLYVQRKKQYPQAEAKLIVSEFPSNWPGLSVDLASFQYRSYSIVEVFIERELKPDL